MRFFAFLVPIALLLNACATKRPVDYYYGGYEKAYYHSKKDGTPKSLANYQEALEDIIETSTEKGKRVPPGIYCEYGYLLSKQGKPNAEHYFDLEVSTYPESARFVAFLKTQMKQN